MTWTIRAVMMVLSAGIAITVLSDGIQAAPKRKRDREPPPPEQVVDKRDRIVSLPGSRFNGKTYWQSLGQCGGIWFKVNSLHGDAAARALVLQRDRKTAEVHKAKAEEARKIATDFFNGAEQVLRTDRDIGREEAVVIYDVAAREAGDKLTAIDLATAEGKACDVLYQACNKAMPKVCVSPAGSARTGTGTSG